MRTGVVCTESLMFSVISLFVAVFLLFSKQILASELEEKKTVFPMSNLIAFLEPNDIMAYMEADPMIRNALLETIMTCFFPLSDASDEELERILMSLLSTRQITWHGPAQRLPMMYWNVMDVSLRTLSADQELMKDPRMASLVLKRFFATGADERSVEGYHIILENIAENVLPQHFGNHEIVTRFCCFAHCSRSGLFDYFRNMANIRLSYSKYNTSAFVRAYLHSYLAHLLVAAFINISAMAAVNSNLIILAILFALPVANYLFDKIMLPF